MQPLFLSQLDNNLSCQSQLRRLNFSSPISFTISVLFLLQNSLVSLESLEINLLHIMFSLIRTSLRLTRSVENVKCFHSGSVFQGFNEFYDVKVPGEVLVTGRSWTLADVRRKVRVTLQQVLHSLGTS